MKVELLRAARIKHNAGEIVEVSPAEFAFLVSTGSAKPCEAAEEQPKKRGPYAGSGKARAANQDRRVR